MTTLIEKIQAEIDRAAEYSTPDNSILVMSRDYIIAGYRDEFAKGAKFILPLLRKAIAQRDWWLSELNEQYGDDLQGVTERENSRLLKLIGCEHE